MGYSQDQTAGQSGDREPTFPEIVVTPESAEESAGVAETYQPPPDLYRFPFTSAVAGGYSADSVTTGTKIDVPLIDFPASVQTITRGVLDDQQDVTLYDVLHNVSSLYRDDGAGGINDKLIIRGFSIEGTGSEFRKNGFRDSSRAQREMANVQRIEVLKGPASVLYGASGQPSGIVNLITKRPLAYYNRSLEAQFGYFDQYRFTFDTTGPFPRNRNALYRLNLAVEDSGSFRDFVFKDRFFISPVVAFALDYDTTLTVETEWLHDLRMPDRGIPFYNGSFRAVPISRFLGEPDNRNRIDDGQFGVFLDRRVNGRLAWRAGYVSNWSDESRRVVEPTELSGTKVKRRLKDDHTVDGNHFFIGDVTAQFYTARIEHRLLLGTELGTDIRHKREDQGKATNLDIFNPVYGATQPAPDKRRRADIQDDQYGLYVQDLIDIRPKLKALVGVRWDSYQRKGFDSRSVPAAVSVQDDAWSPRFGLVLEPIEKVFSIYTAYSESFQSQSGFSRIGSPFVPETGRAYEVGFKLELLDQRLSANFAGFDIFRENILVGDPIDPDYSIQLGQAEGKGVEFDVAGQLTERWSIIANCGYVDAKITNDTDASRKGDRLPNVPYFSTSVWTRYNILQSPHRTLGVAMGVIYRGTRQGDVDNSYQLPDYARWDAGLYYGCKRLQFALVAENLLDEFYIAAGKSEASNIPGAPFGLTGSVRVNY